MLFEHMYCLLCVGARVVAKSSRHEVQTRCPTFGSHCCWICAEMWWDFVTVKVLNRVSSWVGQAPESFPSLKVMELMTVTTASLQLHWDWTDPHYVCIRDKIVLLPVFKMCSKRFGSSFSFWIWSWLVGELWKLFRAEMCPMIQTNHSCHEVYSDLIICHP